jgi:ribosomal protein S18
MSVAALPILLVIVSCAENGQAKSPQGLQSKEFQAGIDKYMEIHRKAVSSVPSIPKETTDTALIAKHQEQIAEAIRGLRPNALVGEVFTPGVRQLIVTTIKQKVDGKAGESAKATILGEGNPKSAESPAPVNLRVNGTYPSKAPLSTVPPSVLMALPMLPKELEYRFVGKNLILRDVPADLIVDFIPNAM